MITLYGLLLPFLGTTLGAAGVLFMKRTLGLRVGRALIGFAAGAMLYVVEELIPEMSVGAYSTIGTVFFAVGFSMMMVLDVVPG